MQHLLEQLTQEQLLKVISMLEDDQKPEVIQYIAENSSLNELQALKVIDAIVSEHDEVLKQYTQGPRFTEDVPQEIQTEAYTLNDEIEEAISNTSGFSDTNIAAEPIQQQKVVPFPTEHIKSAEPIVEPAPEPFINEVTHTAVIEETPPPLTQTAPATSATSAYQAPEESQIQSYETDQDSSPYGMIWMGLGVFVVLLFLIWLIS